MRGKSRRGQGLVEGLDTLAAAYAEVGDFATAVKWQAKAIELETDPKSKEPFRKRLELYQDTKPYRESRL